MAAERRYLSETGSRPGPAAGPGRGPADAGPARLGVSVPGRGTRPARGPRHPVRADTGSRLRALTRCGEGPGWLPDPTALDSRRPVVRLQHRRRTPAAAILVRPAQRPGARTRPRLHPDPVPAGAELAPKAAGRRKPGVAARHQRAGAALYPSRRLAVGHQLRAPGRSPAARHGSR